MSKCQRCSSDRIFSFTSKSSDLNGGSFKDKEFDGYFPRDLNLGGGDYVEASVCLECGQVQGSWPVDDPDFEDC